jgi:hypothetical protein
MLEPAHHRTGSVTDIDGPRPRDSGDRPRPGVPGALHPVCDDQPPAFFAHQPVLALVRAVER